MSENTKENIWASSIVFLSFIAVLATLTTVQIVTAITAIVIYLYGKDRVKDEQTAMVGKVFFFISVIEIFFLLTMLVSMFVFGFEVNPS